MIINNSRYIALMVLLENDKKNITLDQSLKKFSRELDNLSKKDRRLINAIIYGTLRWRENLDWIISNFYSYWSLSDCLYGKNSCFSSCKYKCRYCKKNIRKKFSRFC
ncbi:MAG: hypothetical protein B6I26_07815 [Desulfobacteraceae bacterium 4572_130]|nr:MAG: hypothetical protein B6I26_07815 [Desulfobacteraceae bacterium 4572_130]